MAALTRRVHLSTIYKVGCSIGCSIKCLIYLDSFVSSSFSRLLVALISRVQLDPWIDQPDPFHSVQCKNGTTMRKHYHRSPVFLFCDPVLQVTAGPPALLAAA